MAGQQHEYDPHGAPPAPGMQEKAVEREYSTYITDADAAKMCQLFADGLESGAGYARIFDFMGRQNLDAKMIERLRYAVLDRGDRLGEAFARLGLLDAPARKLILVAEEQASLPRTFKQLGYNYSARLKRKKDVFFGLVETFILIFLGGILFPTLFYAGMKAKPSEVNDELFNAGITAGLQISILASAIGICFYIWINLPVEFATRSIARGIWIRIPLLSTAARHTAVATFCGFFRQSLTSGLDIYRSLELAAEAADTPQISPYVNEALDAIEAGYPLDSAIGVIRGLPDEVPQHIGIGEETGRLEERLDFLTERYDELSREAFRRTINTVVYLARIAMIIVIIGGALYITTSSLGGIL